MIRHLRSRSLKSLNPFAELAPRTFRHPFVCESVRKMSPKDKYTDPELRDQVKEEIHNSNKGGAPGQWSARKVRRPTGLPAP